MAEQVDSWPIPGRELSAGDLFGVISVLGLIHGMDDSWSAQKGSQQE